jgi:hypothetical protein
MLAIAMFKIHYMRSIIMKLEELQQQYDAGLKQLLQAKLSVEQAEKQVEALTNKLSGVELAIAAVEAALKDSDDQEEK